MHPTPKFQEEYSAKIPALLLLCNLGWRYLLPSHALALRGGDKSAVVLIEVLRGELAKRRFVFEGKSYPLSERAIDDVLSQLSPALNEGLQTANERIYNHLLYGISVTEFVGGKKANPTIALIDWDNPANNDFSFTEEFRVTCGDSAEYRQPDMVCFVNGIPLAVIEAKRPDGKKGATVAEGISQTIRNQRTGEIPQLFAYSQLLLSVSGVDGRYATCGTPAKFWAAWREEIVSEADMTALKNQRPSETALADVFANRADKYSWYEQWSSAPLALNGQDRLIIGLLSKERLLEMVRFFVLFDKKVGKIVARYQQVFAIKRLLARMAVVRVDGSREGGVIWHTTGSGKSFTMVFLSKALILDECLKRCRLIVVTDRVDLENQLAATFMNGGELAGRRDKSQAMATSGTRLAQQIGKGNERIIFTLVQKFNSATKLAECFNDSADLIVLVDEGHRSQGGENHIRMKHALPHAAFVAFTGTPLLKDDKTTHKFGSIIHAYTMQRAVEDGTVTPLLYEERIPDLEVNARAIDSWFERMTKGLNEQQKSDLKRCFAQKNKVYGADDRIRLIALDIANHFAGHISDGLKGQLACDSKTSAIRYKQYLDEAGLFESAIVMSPPDSREGNLDESHSDEVVQWWADNVGSQDEQTYSKNIIARFADEADPLKLLIVVDKLLTGFDEPKNTVLYIDKPLKQHNLIQAIARVNRLHPAKKFGLLIDYRGILKELDTTITRYQDLAARTQGGYDIADIDGLYQPMSHEYKKLPMLYDGLWAIFSGVKNKHDIEQLRQVLIPKMVEQNGEWTDTALKVREDFYAALTAFSSCLKVALQSATFFVDQSYSETDRRHYKDTLAQFSHLRRLAQQDAGESVDFDDYADSVKKLLDKHVVGVAVKEPEGVYEVGKMGKLEHPEDWSKEKTRNETDLIKTRIARTIEQDLRDDPYAQQAFSRLLKEVIAEAEQLFDYELKQYWLFHEFEQQVANRRLDDIPDVFGGNFHAQAYYGVFKQTLPETFSDSINMNMDTNLDTGKWVKLAFEIDNIVSQSVAEHSINPHNIETDIRKQLLPKLFAECKAIGAGMEQAKKMVEAVVQIVRVGQNKS
ncbi:type I restriction enzyme, R subunit [Pasteurella testudinis DSM 23072]|uniref:Type I restriction enzyme endonuclease subunit n=1 Tax=Pasteurella testudinis DSM 23072 TaxID=1122938 RepID=A0A1W1V6X1_9PAST|nr:type I restriction endonuclease subunit R [Pasteurella testudinis]SMB89025.1 type I restriction enzyme, R subunit [Pasteurella testudinis DSM 23072]SUB50221.1 type I site-specific deoxyribonuclease [Pasteurella testudinis]